MMKKTEELGILQQQEPCLLYSKKLTSMMKIGDSDLIH